MSKVFSMENLNPFHGWKKVTTSWFLQIRKKQRQGCNVILYYFILYFLYEIGRKTKDNKQNVLFEKLYIVKWTIKIIYEQKEYIVDYRNDPENLY